MTSLCVFCGSSMGRSPDFVEGAKAVAAAAVARGIRVVYGGGKVGLMGVVADEVLARGGEVVGVIPQVLVDKELAHRGLTTLRIAKDMTERKRIMAELADAFVALPGGFGTLEEVSEILSWAQIGLHDKPCGFLNTGGYYDSLLAFFDRAVEQGFLLEASRRLALVDSDPASLLERLAKAGRRYVDRW